MTQAKSTGPLLQRHTLNSYLRDNMSKHARHQPGFYATLLNDVCDRACNFKYRPKVKPTVMGVYEVERIVAKQVEGGKS